MSTLTFEERMQTVESLAIKIYNDTTNLATFDELDAVVTPLFEDIKDVEDRIVALKNNIDMVIRIISPATR